MIQKRFPTPSTACQFKNRAQKHEKPVSQDLLANYRLPENINRKYNRTMKVIIDQYEMYESNC